MYRDSCCGPALRLRTRRQLNPWRRRSWQTCSRVSTSCFRRGTFIIKTSPKNGRGKPACALRENISIIHNGVSDDRENSPSATVVSVCRLTFSRERGIHEIPSRMATAPRPETQWRRSAGGRPRRRRASTREWCLPLSHACAGCAVSRHPRLNRSGRARTHARGPTRRCPACNRAERRDKREMKEISLSRLNRTSGIRSIMKRREGRGIRELPHRAAEKRWARARTLPAPDDQGWASPRRMA